VGVMAFLTLSSWPQTVRLAVRGLRGWTARQVWVPAGTAAGFGLPLGLAPVLVPSASFGRDTPPRWRDDPVPVPPTGLAGMLVATDVQDSGQERDRRTSRLGVLGGVLAWFAVGCPVCNKLALLALGYSGAITWFAPVQPFLALGGLALTGVALVWRLRGPVACPVPGEEAVR